MAPIHGLLTEADYLAAQRLHMKPRSAFAIVALALVALAVASFIASPSWMLGAALAMLAATFFVYLPFNAKRTFRQYKALSEPTSIEVRDEGVYFKRETGEGLVPWSHVVKWRHSSTLLLLYPANRVFYLIPAHFFQDQSAFASFVSVIESKLGRAR
jgi:hypothetical protein